MKYWAYLHVNGNVVLKQYWGTELSKAVIDDAYDSSFVKNVLDPFEAKDRAEALRIASAKLRGFACLKKVYRVWQSYNDGDYDDHSEYINDFGVFSSEQAAVDRRDEIVCMLYPDAELVDEIDYKKKVSHRISALYVCRLAQENYLHKYLVINIDEFVVDEKIARNEEL